jgi:hypothetical protein
MSTVERNPIASADLAGRPVVEVSGRELLVSLVHGWCLTPVVPIAIDLVERDPLLSVWQFPGDLLRGLMEVPGAFWGRYPRLFDRYRQALRAAAVLRRQLPHDERMRFWEPLVVPPE